MPHHYEIPELLQGQSTSIRAAAARKATHALACDSELFANLSVGQRCVALYQSPTQETPKLRFTWTTDDKPLGPDWKPFHIFRSDLAMPQNAVLMNCALYVCPILLEGEYTDVEIVKAETEITTEPKEGAFWGTLSTLAAELGHDNIMEFLENECQDSVCPAICTNCKDTCEGEPDLDQGWCEGCGHQSVKSALIIAGVI